MSRTFLAGLGLIVAIVAETAAAQDIAPAINPIENARGLHTQSMMGAHARRIRERDGTAAAATTRRPPSRARQAYICRQRPAMRAQVGAGDPRYQQLDGLCKRAGF